MANEIYNNNFIDPYELLTSQLPVFILCDNLRDFIGWSIKAHTSGNYSHCVVMINPYKVVSQDVVLNERLIDSYRSEKYVLKFYQIKNITEDEKQLITNAVKDDLNKPWYKRFYDVVGFVGQAFDIYKLQLPSLNYCSENVAKYMRLIPRIALWLPKEVSPSKINDLCKQHPEDVELLGYWIKD